MFIYKTNALTDISESNTGYCKLYRSFINWEWFNDINVSHLFLYCLLRANYEDTEWRGIKIKKGSFVTSLETLSKSTGLTIQQVRTAISKLKLTHELTYQTTSRYSIITINNWNLYQENNTQINNHVNKQITTDKNNKNNIYKEENKNFRIPTLEEIKKYCEERKNNVNPEQFYDYYSSNGWKVGKNPMKDWKAAVRTWEQNCKTVPNNRREAYDYNPNL